MQWGSHKYNIKAVLDVLDSYKEIMWDNLCYQAIIFFDNMGYVSFIWLSPSSWFLIYAALKYLFDLFV